MASCTPAQGSKNQAVMHNECFSCCCVLLQDGETSNTVIMAHPPGSEGEPDDRSAYVQDNGYAEDADGNAIMGGDTEQGGVPEGWPTHDASAMQVRRKPYCTSLRHSFFLSHAA